MIDDLLTSYSHDDVTISIGEKYSSLTHKQAAIVLVHMYIKYKLIGNEPLTQRVSGKDVYYVCRKYKFDPYELILRVIGKVDDMKYIALLVDSMKGGDLLLAYLSARTLVFVQLYQLVKEHDNDVMIDEIINLFRTRVFGNNQLVLVEDSIRTIFSRNNAEAYIRRIRNQM